MTGVKTEQEIEIEGYIERKEFNEAYKWTITMIDDESP